MSHSKEVVPFSKEMELSVPVSELLPAAKKTALLFHISYLCMANFPALERELRAKATDAQLLFSSSASLLLQCVSTSENMINTLIPMLKAAIDKNRPLVAVKYLEKARRWIEGLIHDVVDTVERYSTLNRNVGSTASDVIATKTETEKKIQSQTKEVEDMKKKSDMCRKKLNDVKARLQRMQGEINAENARMQSLVNSIADRNRQVCFVVAVIPFIGLIVHVIQKAVNDPGDNVKLEASRNKLKQLNNDKGLLSQEEWKLEAELMNTEMLLAKLSMELDSIPSPTHLAEVQECLTKIQGILLRLKEFWDRVNVMLDSLSKKTFAAEDMIDDLDIFKSEILASLDTAQKYWASFGAICLSVKGTFSVESKDAYKFLEFSPSSLSKEKWQEQYDSVQKQLKEVWTWTWTWQPLKKTKRFQPLWRPNNQIYQKMPAILT
ncbi:hypothetical protein MATL_G00022460 [Megalops atlanticus]|uniref:Restin-like protein n=1 Tax=Megalops atlanticus TaxID=7932 RepID=A0A9D3QH23_MEGAT|nr:hypothetical protein MATL_G00022460 [Megalops atlanticus]